MASRSPQTTRNVAFCGHGTCGKTSLVEALLAAAKAIPRKGSVDDGTSVCDFDDQEKEKQYSIDLALAHLEHNGTHVQLIDVPGYRDFVGNLYCAATAVECAVVVVDSDDGVRPNTRKVWEVMENAGVPCMVVVNRCDREHAKSDEVVEQIQQQLSASCHPINKPDSVGPDVSSVASVLDDDGLKDAIAESDDALMEQYLGGEDISADAWRAQLVKAVASRSVFPILFTSSAKDVGLTELLDAIAEFAPPATDMLGRTVHAPAGEGETPEGQPIDVDVDGPLRGVVFRVASDPYVGKMTYLRLLSGSLATNGQFINPNTGKPDKAGKFVRMQGKEQEGVDTAVAGDIVALVKVEGLKAFDIVSSDSPLAMTPPKLPTPMYGRAVTPKSKADEKKFGESLTKVVDEDVMVTSYRDNRTNEMVVSGVSQLHLGILWERLKSRYGVEVSTAEPKTPYLETVTGGAAADFRHKKQSGGSGEFAEVHLKVDPVERGAGIEFTNSVFGGAISATYVQSAEKGIRSVLESGVIAGYPVVDVKVDIYDGKEHPVDSKDIAFQKAGREAFKKAFNAAKPVLLEPIVDLEVTFPGEHMGDIQGDLNRRRGRVNGMDAMGDFQVVRAQVPLAELTDYSTTLDSITAGQGSFAVDMSHYDVVPPNIQQKVCEQAKAEMEEVA